MSVIRLLIADGLAYVTVDESLGDRDRECFSHYLLVSEIAQNSFRSMLLGETSNGLDGERPVD